MKGIAHFATGIAIASFFPEIVQGAALGAGFGPVLGGIAALLPDTLDFKFLRFLCPWDQEIDPAQVTTSSGEPDPQAMADRVAAAMDCAFEKEQRLRIHLHTLRKGLDMWRQYAVILEPGSHEILVRLGPLVTTSQRPFAGSLVSGCREGRAQARMLIDNPYHPEMCIDILDGPTLALEKKGAAVRVTWLPWHRAWTHSLFMVLAVGLLGCLLGPVYGLLMALAVLSHIVQDQLGFMGSSLFFPLQRNRVPGLGLFASSEALPNVLTVWCAVMVTFLNLDRFSLKPSLPLWTMLVLGVVIPIVLGVGFFVQQRSSKSHTVFATSGAWEEFS